MTTQGSRLRNIRRELKIPQDKFGEMIGVSKQYISNIEKDRNLLNNEKLTKLLVDFNVNINYVLAGIGEPFNINKQEEITKERVQEIVKEVLNSYARKRYNL